MAGGLSENDITAYVKFAADRNLLHLGRYTHPEAPQSSIVTVRLNRSHPFVEAVLADGPAAQMQPSTPSDVKGVAAGPAMEHSFGTTDANDELTAADSALPEAAVATRCLLATENAATPGETDV